jgi:Tol biopolymer transport system component
MLALVAACLALPASLAPRAEAAFPGGNGKIAFASQRDGDREIYVMNADGSSQTRLATNPAIDGAPAWSADGQKIAFVRHTARQDVYVMNADGSSQTQLTAGPGNSIDPAWSPDGQKIVFVTHVPGQLRDVYVMNADGSSRTQLTTTLGDDLAPAWSPDGQKIAFLSARDGNGEIYVMNADGSSQTRLTTAAGVDIWPDWSPDGQKIAFVSLRDGNGEIYVMNADGSSQTRLTSAFALDTEPAWSPDGQKIAFTSFRDGDGDIYVMNADGSAQTRLTMAALADSAPDWQPLPESVSFDWTVPARFGADADGNGMLDYFPPDGSLEIEPAGFQVDFTTDTPSNCDATLSRTWSIDGVAVAAGDPRIEFYDPNDCRFSYRFDEEGTYEVTVEVEREDGTAVGSKTQQVVVQDFLLVSLGDSVASGEGNPDLPQTGGPERWQNQQCHRSAFAGPAQAALQVEQADAKTSVTFLHLACSGAKVDEGVLGGYRGIEPGSLLPPQVDQMRDLVGQREIDAVLVSVGANDVQFSTLIFRCFTQPLCDQDRPGSAARLFEQRIVPLPGRYDQLDAALQPPQVPPERVYVSEYFDPTRDGSGGFCDSILADHPAGGGAFQITADEARWASENMLVRLNAEVFAATVRHGWRYAGGITNQFLSHGYCAPLNWVDTYSESIVLQGDENGTLHPNRPGHLAYAGRIAPRLRADLYEGGDLTKPRPPE